MNKATFIQAFIAGIGMLLMLNCARTINPDIERGTSYQYQVGYPEVRLSAVGFFDEQNNPQIDIVADIVYGSVVFKRKGNKRRANLAIELRIFDQENDDAIISSKRFSFDQEIEDPKLARSQNVFTLNRQVQVEPGKYKIELTVIDQTVSRKSTRIFTTSIPNPEQDISSLTNIRMEGKEIGKYENSWFPVTTYDTPGKLDSLKFIYQMINKSENQVTINSKLVKFRTDTSAATPMNQSYNNAPIIWDKGIDYGETETIQSNKRVLMQQGNVSIEFYFPSLSRGNYRFEVDLEGDSNRELYKARDFSIKSHNYPTLKTPAELARPLIYIMDRKNYEKLTSIKNQDELKQEIDRFWLKHTRNKSLAKSVLEIYYERVEEANKKFSNFKEGWKTDRGMIYILFGNPWYENDFHKSLSWSYTYNLSDPYLNFEFMKAKIKSEYFPFDHYVLQRSPSYYNIQRRQVQLWLSGQILVRKI